MLITTRRERWLQSTFTEKTIEKLCVTFALSIFSVYYRMEGFIKKAGKLGMEVEIIEGSFDVGHAYDLMNKRLKEKGTDFTAVFVSADMLAIEVLKALADNGVDVPHEVSVMGFDDAYFSRYTKPALTAIRQPRTEMGLTAAQLLLSKLSSTRPHVIRKMILPVEIVERESVREIPEG